MPSEFKTISVPPNSELARLLGEVGDGSVLVTNEGTRYRLSREEPAVPEDLWANYDPERVRAGLRQAAGTISPVDAERLKELIYRGREEGTRRRLPMSFLVDSDWLIERSQATPLRSKRSINCAPEVWQ